MKRPSKHGHRFSTIKDIKAEIAPERLAGVGAVALSWTQLESLVDFLFWEACDLPDVLRLEITTRIHGFDGKIAILKTALRTYRALPEQVLDAMLSTLAAAEEHKRYRDAVEHALVLSPDSDIAQTIQRRGRIDEVLISTDALDTLYEHIIAVGDELFLMLKMIVIQQLPQIATKKFDLKEPPDSVIEQTAEALLSFLAQLRGLQSKRKGLRTLPAFPAEPQAAGG